MAPYISWFYNLYMFLNLASLQIDAELLRDFLKLKIKIAWPPNMSRQLRCASKGVGSDKSRERRDESTSSEDDEIREELEASPHKKRGEINV